MDITTIPAELNRLGQLTWFSLIDTIIYHFEGYPFDHPDTQNAHTVILTILRSLPRKPADTNALTDEIFITRLSGSDLFSHRAFRQTPEGARYWEPLKERYADFVRAGETVQYQAEHEYPAPDIIRNWCHHQLRLTRQ